MKFVPAFFLVGLSVLHLIYVIAAPNAKRSETERQEARKAAALSRFNISKRYAPFKSPWKRRLPVTIKLRKYKNYLRAVIKRYLGSAKSEVSTQMTGFRERFYQALGRDIEVLRSFQAPYARKNWQKQSTESKLGTDERHQTLSKLTIDEEDLDDSVGFTIQTTASLYEMFRQITQELLLRIQSFGTVSGADRSFKSLKASELLFRAKTQQMLKEIQRKQAEGDELFSGTFVPIPSEVPSLEPLPGTVPEPSVRESITHTVEDTYMEYSRTHAPSSSSKNGIATLAGSVLTFRRLTRFAARI